MLLCEKEDSGTYDNFIWSSDSCLDGFTFDQLIFALRCNFGKKTTEKDVWKTFNEILETQIEDAKFLLEHSMQNVIKAAKGELDD